MEYYLAIDIGASSGRLISGHLDNGKLVTETVYAFPNGAAEKNGHLTWDTEGLFAEIVKGLKICREKNRIPKIIGIDTWGVDFALLDRDGKPTGDCVAYRDGRTEDIIDEVHGIIPFEKLYAKTGIQFQPFNTVYQLYALKKQSSEEMDRAEYFLMMPDYLSYLLTGDIRNEYTNATTTGLVNAKSGDWDADIIKALGLPERFFRDKPVKPGSYTVPLKKEIADEVGFCCRVAISPSHDTASAFIGVPKSEESVIISSGTWSLLGVENSVPITDGRAMSANFTNEGGAENTYRFLKNIMGLWMLQNFRKEQGITDFTVPAALAKEGEHFAYTVNAEDKAFLAPVSMCGAVRDYCLEKYGIAPETKEEIAYCIYNSLALGYKNAIKELEGITGKKYNAVNVVGGGSQDGYLCSLTAKRTGLKVIAGPKEGTAVGNIMQLMMSDKVFENISRARECLGNSTEVKYYD